MKGWTLVSVVRFSDPFPQVATKSSIYDFSFYPLLRIYVSEW